MSIFELDILNVFFLAHRFFLDAGRFLAFGFATAACSFASFAGWISAIGMICLGGRKASGSESCTAMVTGEIIYLTNRHFG